MPIFFPNDPLEGPVVDFLGALGRSPYWSAIAAEYGVGEATLLPAVHVTTAAPASSTAWFAVVGDCKVRVQGADGYPDRCG